MTIFRAFVSPSLVTLTPLLLGNANAMTLAVTA
jgi:hypothetical protein